MIVSLWPLFLVGTSPSNYEHTVGTQIVVKTNIYISIITCMSKTQW